MTSLRVKRAGSGEVAEAADDVEPGDAPWSKLEMLMCDLIDATNENTWAVLQVNSEKTVPKPEPTARPGVSRSQGKHQYAKQADPRLVEWLTKRQNGEDTSELDAELNLQNVTPMRPMTQRGDGDGGHGGRGKP